MSALTCSSLFSAAPQAWGFNPETQAKAGRGSQILLNDDNWYLDLTSSNGRNLIGHGGDFADYVSAQVRQGIGFPLPHILEYEVADRLADLLGHTIPGFDNLGGRFGKSGSDVTTAAVRLARAATDRKWILCFENCYHGWGDWTIARTKPAWGIISEQRVIDLGQFGDMETVMGLDFGNEVAAIIFEQPATDPDPDWYPFLRKWCNDNGALLIADEIVTGLRYAPGGACQKYGIEPDLVCMAKGLGNGVAVSALIGRKEYMDWFARTDPVFWSSTTNGNANDLAAANYVLREWQERGERNVVQLWELGDRLLEGCQEFLSRVDGWSIFGHGVRSVFQFSDEVEQGFFIQGMKRQGILANRPNFPNLSMRVGQVDQVVQAVGEVVEERQRLDRAEVEALVRDRLPRVLFKNR